MVSFNEIPNDVRRPQVLIEIDSSRAVQGPAIKSPKILVVGMRKAGGEVPALVPIRARSEDQVASYFGANSQIAQQAKALFANNKVDEVTFIGINEPGGGSDAVGTITVTGPATAAGTIYLYVGGKRFQIAVASGDSASTIATAIQTELAADTEIPFDVTVLSEVVTLTAGHAGTWANNYDVRANYYIEDEEFPAGVGLTIVEPTGGTGATDPSGVWDKLGETQYDHIVMPTLTTADLTAVEAQLDELWGPLEQREAHVWMSVYDTYANLATLGSGENSEHVTVIGATNMPSPTYMTAAAFCGMATRSLAIDPARPLQTLTVNGLLPPAKSNQLTRDERELLLKDGITTFAVNQSGEIVVERVITTYQQNDFGADSTAFLDVNTKATVSYLRYALRNRLQLRYPRHKLAKDGAVVRPGSAMVTPNMLRGEIIGWFKELEEIGLVEQVDQFARDLIVEINASDPNRVDVQLAPDLVNQLRIFAIQLQFIL